MNDHLVIFDTTLRDGEQSPGASMTKEEKLRVARQLERMRVDVIEAGFAAASPGDFDAIRSIAEVVRDSTVCSLARANENDIRRAGEAIKPASSGRIHTFIATSPIHMEKKLRMTPDQVVEQAVRAVHGRESTPTTSSSLQRMPAAPNWSSSAGFSMRSSRPARRRSTCRIPSATTCRDNSRPPSVACARGCRILTR